MLNIMENEKPKITKIEKPILQKPVLIKEAGKKADLNITLDTKTSSVIEYDREGLSLKFESAPGLFKELGKEVLESLSTENRNSYFISYGLMRKEKDSIISTSGLVVNPVYANATNRTKVDAPPEFRKLWQLCWKRPDQLQMAKSKGYKYVTQDDPVTGFSRDARGHWIVGVAGAIELELMKVPKVIYDGIKNKYREESRLRNASLEDESRENLKRLGAKKVI